MLRLVAPYPSDLREWDLPTLADALGFSATSVMCAAIGSVDKWGYAPFVLTGEGGGRRVIHAPKRWLKEIQRETLRSVINHIPISDLTHSCRGRGVITNAKQHVGNAYVTLMDVADCFPSTKSRAVLESFESVGVRSSVAGTLTRLTTYRGLLPQGPPTSPAVRSETMSP